MNEDEDDLTHFGQSLSSIEKFEEPVLSDEEEDGGRIDGQWIKYYHYFMLIVYQFYLVGMSLRVIYMQSKKINYPLKRERFLIFCDYSCNLLDI